MPFNRYNGGHSARRPDRLPDRCACALCRRHRRVRYVVDVLRRAGDEPAAAFVETLTDALLEAEADIQMRDFEETDVGRRIAQARTTTTDVDTRGRV